MSSKFRSRPDLPDPPQRPVPAAQCWLAYAAALAVGAGVWRPIGQLVADPFWQGLWVSVVATVVIWLFSMRNDNSSIYDPYWVIAPPFLAMAVKATSSGLTDWTPRQLLVLVFVLAWSTRYHTMYPWDGWRTGLTIEDWRYENMRSAPVPYWLNSLLGMHLFPTVLVWFAFAPGVLVLTQQGSGAPLGVWDVVAVVAAVTAVGFQFFADQQLKAFRSTPEYRDGKTIRLGLWNWSRHPNYFGEVLIWWSMLPLAVASGAFDTAPFLCLAGPAAMALFFRFSAWLMDMRSLQRRPDFDRAMAEVSAIVPWFPRRG